MRNKTIVAIHQPNYFPWLGFFDKISKSDVFVLLDNVQYPKRSWVNRVKIKNNDGEFWLSIPVKVKNRYHQKIKEAEIDGRDWKRKHINSISRNYSRSACFKTFFPVIRELIDSELQFLADFNRKIIGELCSILGIKTNFVMESELNIKSKSTDLLIDIVKEVKGTTYLCGNGAEGYQEDEKFVEEGIELIYQNFEHPVYMQQYQGFISGLSIVDLLMNCGEKSINSWFE